MPPSELSYTEATRELEAIVEFFEQREVDVDQLVARLERATAIVDELDRRIHQTRTQVEELVPKLEAVARERDEGAGDASEESTGPRGTAHQSSDEDEPLF
jgi:exodeoxyribonuclease VII small subunit